MAGIAERLKNTDREFYETGGTSVFSFSAEATHPRLHQALYLLLAAATFLLLIACANLANLTLSRAALRSREIMVRVALGATRSRILTQLVSESLLISLVGAALGVMLARWSLHLILAFKPPDIHRPELIVINLPVLLFAASAAVLTTCLFGLWPALAVSRVDISSRLKAGGGWGASAARLRGRQFLIVFEVALALILLVGAGLMIRSLQELASVGVGFDITHLATLDVRISEKSNPDFSTRVGLVRRLIAHTQSVPGSRGAAVANSMPLHSLAVAVFHIPSQPELERDSAPIADLARVSPGFFQVIRLRLAAGRWLTDADLTSNGSPKEVAMVNQAFARKYFPRQNPLNQRLQSGDRKENFEIVGVVEDFRPMGAEYGVRAEIFRPSTEFTDATLVVRSRGEPQLIAKSLLEVARSITPDLPDNKVKTLEEDAEQWTARRKFNTVLLWIFAGPCVGARSDGNLRRALEFSGVSHPQDRDSHDGWSYTSRDWRPGGEPDPSSGGSRIDDRPSRLSNAQPSNGIAIISGSSARPAHADLGDCDYLSHVHSSSVATSATSYRRGLCRSVAGRINLTSTSRRSCAPNAR